MFDWRNLARIALLAGAVGVAASCSEKLEGGAACATLCPNQDIVIRDTTLRPVTTSVTVSGYPPSGAEGRLLLAARGSALDSRVVIRFDSLARRYARSATDTTTLPITTPDSTRLRLRIDVSQSVITGPASIDVFDVDTTTADTAVTAVLPLFRSGGATNRLIGTRTFTQAELIDSISVPVSDSAIAARIAASGRVRLGLRVRSATNTQLRLVASEAENGTGVSPILRFRPTRDTVASAFSYSPRDVESTSAQRLLFDRRDYTVVAAGASAASGDPAIVEVGGLPSRRGYLRFVLPDFFVDSSVTIVRASLALELTPVVTAGMSDTVTVFPLVGLAGAAVTDPQRAAGVADVGALGNSGLLPLDSIIVPTGVATSRSVNVLRAVRYWSAASEKNNPHALVLVVRNEGTTAGVVRFVGASNASVAARPRLVLSYVTRVPFALP